MTTVLQGTHSTSVAIDTRKCYWVCIYQGCRPAVLHTDHESTRHNNFICRGTLQRIKHAVCHTQITILVFSTRTHSFVVFTSSPLHVLCSLFRIHFACRQSYFGDKYPMSCIYALQDGWTVCLLTFLMTWISRAYE